MNWLNSIINDNIQFALGWAVVHSLWQGLVIALIMAILNMSLPKLSSTIRYWIANSALLLMLMFFIGTFYWAYYKHIEDLSTPLRIVIDSNTLYTEGVSEAAPQRNPWIQSITHFMNDNMPLIVVVWLLGVLFFVLRLMGGLMYIEILRNRHLLPISMNEDGPEWQARLNVFKNKLRIRQVVSLYESALVGVPMVVGWLKPIILMPIGTINHIPPSQVEAILAHELAHIAGRDYLINIVQTIVEILFYYHPAVWWISANIRTERENRCDDIAVSLCGNSLTYAKALLTIQEMQHQNMRAYGLAMTFSGQRKGLLLNRIKRILNQPQNRSNIMEKLAATGLLMGVVATLAFSNYAQTTPPNLKDSASTTEQTVIMTSDSLPQRLSEMTIIKDEDGKAVEMHIKNGAITQLKIDGKEIAEKDFDKYKNLTDELTQNLPVPPAPPAPPTPPMPPAPPAPPSGIEMPIPPTPPVPPTPPSMSHFYIKSKSFIKKEKDEQGNTILKMDKGNGKFSEIRITPDKEVYINGKKAENDKFMELGDTEGERFQFFNPNDSSFFKELKKLELTTPHFDFDKNDFKLNLDDNFIIKIDPKHQERLSLQREKLRNQIEKLRKDNEKLFIKETDGLFHIEPFKNIEKRQFYFDNDRFAQSQQDPKSAIVSELKRDGFITKDKKSYSFELSNKRLKINGKEMPDELRNKYAKLYQGSNRQEKFNIKIEEEID